MSDFTSDWKTAPADVIDAGPGDGSVWAEAIDFTGDGDEWWILGHVDDISAFRAWYSAIEHSDYDWIEKPSDLCITREWWKPTPTPDNDEQMSRCTENDPDAQPFTRVEL